MKPWIYTQNPFLNATANSYKNALAISMFHDCALENAIDKPFFLELYNFYHPLHTAYCDAYNAWKAQNGNQEGATLNINQLLQILSSTKIKEWDIKILNLFPQDTSMYKTLLPHRRGPFQKGPNISRITAVKTLSDSLASIDALANLKTNVDKFYDELETAFNDQKRNIKRTKNFSSDVEAMRIDICVAQFANYASLLQKFITNPKAIEIYFDLASIRRRYQVVYKGRVKPMKVYTILKHTFEEDDKIILYNTGPTPLRFYLANYKDKIPGSDFIQIDSGKETVVASSLGNILNTYLTVCNMDKSQTGSFLIEIV